ncbi:uncharacterized protein LOC141610651 [Silene latifolia]|uniref:uncharacterized protein LOC141610651 n=1 Tax=Silene latifolia TaxID=37657 RepID=UPI003D77202E
MGRFSCLYGHLQNHKHKKSTQPSFETMIKMLQVSSPDHTSASSRLAETSGGKNDNNYLGNGTELVSPCSHGWRSREFECENDADSNMDSVHFETGNMRRSLSLGCDLDQKRRISDDDKTDDCVDQVLSFDGSHDCNDTVDLSPPNAAKSAETNSPDHDQEALESLSPNCSSDLVNRESIFSFPNAKYLEEEGHDDCHDSFIAEHVDGCERETAEASRMSKSYSMPNFDCTSPTSPFVSKNALPPHNRSFEDLNILCVEKEDIPAHDACAVDIGEINKDDSFSLFEKFDGENAAFDNYNSFEYGCTSKDWIVPVPDDMGIIEHNRVEDSSSNHWGHFPGQDFKIKRIEDWVIDLQHCSPVEETNETAISNSPVKRASSFLDGLDKMEMKTNPGMEVAKRYISSLNASATTVQLANHGLVAIPLLVAFASLKVLNLSGNSIVRITAGSLPRGLHMLNLSKNKLSTIEGLRELTRLRVLDLSYNKISRIGHGLASCSSVKELYLAGNKISEVEGLHRLLKLAVLDLRFNKIATSKSLGQLAANYNSLQAISLEGNPAQKNVGDEQLKKFVQGLLPQLAYYNRQHIKSSTLKDSSDRAVRLGISAHQFDRGVKSDHKSSSRRSVSKRASHANSPHRQKSQASDSLKQSKGKHAVAPPSSSRASNHHNLLDISSKLRGLKLGASLHKSRSEGALAAEV